jgi:dUTP pyrophosphatase
MNVNIKRLNEDAVVPSYSKDGDAGLDLVATSVTYNVINGTLDYGTGLAVEIPKGYVGLIFPRSSIRNKSLILSNHVGVIDSGYRGEITLSFSPNIDHWGTPYPDDEDFIGPLSIGEFLVYKDAESEYFDNSITLDVYAIGDRIGQLIIMPYPVINFTEVSDLSDSERGSGGFGSTGK